MGKISGWELSNRVAYKQNVIDRYVVTYFILAAFVQRPTKFECTLTMLKLALQDVLKKGNEKMRQREKTAAAAAAAATEAQGGAL